MKAVGITLELLGGEQAATHLEELRALYAEVYAEPPYEWSDEHAALFVRRFQWQCQQDGFALVEARDGAGLAGMTFGLTAQPQSPGWWQDLTTPLPAEVTTERPGRTFGLVELIVRAPWRRQGIAEAMHGLLLKDRREERAVLTALPAAGPAQAAYRKWGWHKVAEKRNPLPGSPLFDVLVKDLGAKRASDLPGAGQP
jgi:GNAT superfamily N-acetyltransferase